MICNVHVKGDILASRLVIVDPVTVKSWGPTCWRTASTRVSRRHHPAGAIGSSTNVWERRGRWLRPSCTNISFGHGGRTPAWILIASITPRGRRIRKYFLPAERPRITFFQSGRLSLPSITRYFGRLTIVISDDDFYRWSEPICLNSCQTRWHAVCHRTENHRRLCSRHIRCRNAPGR